MKKGFPKACGLLVALLMLVASAAHAAAPMVNDEANLFSQSAITEANSAIARIYDHTAPHKQVYVETLPTLPGDKQADTLAEQRFSQHDTDGVLVLIVKDPHKLAVTVGQSTAARFHDGEGVRSVMLARFRHGDYDGGLLAGVRLLESRLTSAFSTNANLNREPVPWVGTTRTEREAASTSSSWLWLLLLCGGGLLALWIWRRRSASQVTPYSASSNVYGASSAHGVGPGVGPVTSGGGWGRSILGGAAGAVAGNWLYDRLFHGNRDGDAYAGTHHLDRNSEYDAPAPDHGEVGSTFGGNGGGDDWTDGGGGDSGGGDGGDW
jgi:uncharacterized protein